MPGVFINLLEGITEMVKKIIIPLIPQDSVILLEKGKEIHVGREAGKALVKSDPVNYAWPKGKTPKVDKPKKDEKPEENETKAPHISDGKFTIEDIEALPHKEKQALAKKLGVSASGTGSDIAKRIMEKV